MFMVACL
jgi:hypothetical protein